jgi:hypothetical protein
VLIFAACALPALVAFWMMWKHWVPVPFWDEWDTPGAQIASYYRGTLNFAELVSQHNEHRLFFPRLVWLPMAILAGWDVRHEMMLTFCFVCLGSIGLFQLLRPSGGSERGWLFVFGLINLLLFSPRQYETFLVGAQGQTFVPTFALVLSLLVNLSRSSLPAKTIANAVLALISTYSFGNGMLVWLLAFPLETRSAAEFPTSPSRAKISWRAAYILAAVICIASYFISYRHPPLSPPVISPIAQLPAIARFVVVWIGSLFDVGAPAICGTVVLLLFVGLTTVALLQIRRSGLWRPHYPWLILGSYTLISGVVAAIARLGFAYSMAGNARYTAFSVFFYIAVIGLGFSVYGQTERRPLVARAALSAAIVSLAVILTCWGITFRKEQRLLRIFTHAWKHSLLVLRWSEAIPLNPEIALLSPYPVGETRGTIRTLAQHDALRPRLVSQKLAGAINERPNADSDGAGMLDAATLDARNHLAFHGWARLPEQDRSADCVVFGFARADGTWTPFCVVETGDNRPDLARQFKTNALSRAGFAGEVEASNLPRGDISFRAWAIDLQSERAFPLAGAPRLEARP